MTIDEFLILLREAAPYFAWRLGRDNTIRVIDALGATCCPITAVVRYHFQRRYNVADFMWANTDYLHMCKKDASMIAVGADTPNLNNVIKRQLCEAVGLVYENH